MPGDVPVSCDSVTALITGVSPPFLRSWQSYRCAQAPGLWLDQIGPTAPVISGKFVRNSRDLAGVWGIPAVRQRFRLGSGASRAGGPPASGRSARRWRRRRRCGRARRPSASPERLGPRRSAGTDRRRAPRGGRFCITVTCSPTSGVRAQTEQRPILVHAPCFCGRGGVPARRGAAAPLTRPHRIAPDGTRERRGGPGRSARGRVRVRRRPRQPPGLHRPLHLRPAPLAGRVDRGRGRGPLPHLRATPGGLGRHDDHRALSAAADLRARPGRAHQPDPDRDRVGVRAGAGAADHRSRHLLDRADPPARPRQGGAGRRPRSGTSATGRSRCGACGTCSSPRARRVRPWGWPEATATPPASPNRIARR